MKENNSILSNQKKQILQETNNLKQNIIINKTQEISKLKKEWETEIREKLEKELENLNTQINIEKSNWKTEINHLNSIINNKNTEILELESNIKKYIIKINELELKIKEINDSQNIEIDEIKNQYESNIKIILESELNEIHLKYKNEKSSLEQLINSMQESIHEYDIKLDNFMQDILGSENSN